MREKSALNENMKQRQALSLEQEVAQVAVSPASSQQDPRQLLEGPSAAALSTG